MTKASKYSEWIDALATVVPDLKHPGTARRLAELMAYLVQIECAECLGYCDPEAIFNDLEPGTVALYR